MRSFIKRIKDKLIHFVYKNKAFKNEEEFYTYFFTRNPSWNSPEGNEDENIRWSEIKNEIDKSELRSSATSILEIGCGRGWLCKKLSPYGTVTGIDPVEPVIKYAKKLFPSIEFHALVPSSFIERFPEKKFDIIVSTEVLEHVDDKKAFVSSIYDMLKKNGILILTTPRAEHFNDFIEFYGQDKKQPVEQWASEQELNDLFENSQFIVQNKNFFSPLNVRNRTVLMTQLWVCKKN